MRYLHRQIDEIAEDPALRAYGAILALTHLLTAFWLVEGGYAWVVGVPQEVFCWPLLPGCESFRVLQPKQLEWAFYAYGAASLVGALAFARGRDRVGAWLGLAALTLFKLGVIALDFRLRRNQHYMAFAATGVFLLLPHKRQALQLLLVLFYFWAGTLKLNWEWLSGGALYRPLPLVTGVGVVVACAYVVALELFVVWGLLSRRREIFWASFAQALAFHVVSWWIVGFFYPLLMFGLLAIYPLCRAFPREGPEAAPVLGLARSTLALAVAFSLLQLSTHLYPGDTAITGEGRLFALHMFDARVRCEARAILHLGEGRQRVLDLSGGGARTACDPLMVRGAALNLCRRRHRGARKFEELDLRLDSRRETETELRRVVGIDGFCADPPSYSAFLHNDWIRTD